jgi:hypothetical protein
VAGFCEHGDESLASKSNLIWVQTLLSYITLFEIFCFILCILKSGLTNPLKVSQS